jgi:hypothetical protein
MSPNRASDWPVALCIHSGSLSVLCVVHRAIAMHGVRLAYAIQAEGPKSLRSDDRTLGWELLQAVNQRASR